MTDQGGWRNQFYDRVRRRLLNESETLIRRKRRRIDDTGNSQEDIHLGDDSLTSPLSKEDHCKLIEQEWAAFYQDSIASTSINLSPSSSINSHNSDEFAIMDDSIAFIRKLIRGTPEYDAFFQKLQDEAMRQILSEIGLKDKDPISTTSSRLGRNEETRENPVSASFPCPVCKTQHSLFRASTLIFCTKCQLRIDTRMDSITFAFLQTRMKESEELHSSQCKHQPFVDAKSFTGFSSEQSLIMSCDECGFLEIIL
ncbi:uncharacterized protein VTP21DRAFT_6453 [Calcarisporiella thermophila]|uniref:uncharacterized protein n=1 Tax=Calcarisporiella thermophila TaxID=911321 RepID=UPI003743187B